ncbi:oxidoreductase [Capsulimonas corticalis]|uniref:Oxidoreductase n=1 Tax=Capsulimonas corticalis TaxID=2219043 RepID=A0A402D1Y7_9BACT|nr:oxidoreductase [Capsulimonas corticalis]BDI30070.1 oxidoreductase [Capsulimonas corticalis]
MVEKIRVGMVGFGLAGRVFHAPVIQSVPDLQLTHVVERHGEESRRVYPEVEIVRDVEHLLEDDEIDLIVVTTPNVSHFEIARSALLADKHVVVEKPFTITSEEARELTVLSHRQGRVLSVHQNRRWDGDFLTVRRVLEANLLGRLVEYESHFDRYRSQPRAGAWREEAQPGAGLLYDLGPHLIDQALILFGAPQLVSADIRTQRDGGKTDDYFDLTLHYAEHGARLKAGVLVREPTPRYALHGVDGSFVKYGLDPQEDALKRGLVPSETPGWGEDPEERWGVLNAQAGGLHVRGKVETLPGCYPGYYQNVADAIHGRAPLEVTPEDATMTMRVIELAIESSREKMALAFEE